jgi:hypothetical protein
MEERIQPKIAAPPEEVDKWKFHASVNRTRSQSSLEEVSCFLELSTVAKFQLFTTPEGSRLLGGTNPSFSLAGRMCRTGWTTRVDHTAFAAPD